MSSSDLRAAAQQALEALEEMDFDDPELNQEWLGKQAIRNLRAALAEPTGKDYLSVGSCIACGNRVTGSPESFVVATAEVGVTAPEGCSPQQVEALHPQKVGDKTSPPLVDRIADCLVEDHIALMRENERLRAALAEPVQEPKRKPLHDMAIFDLADELLYGDKNYGGVLAFARAIEKAHGIGGSDD